MYFSGRQGYLPNITEHVTSRCGTPPALNVVTNSQLFPAVQPIYGGSRWSSQLPESYLPNLTGNISYIFTVWCEKLLCLFSCGHNRALTVLPHHRSVLVC